MKTKVINNKFTKNILVLMSGTAFAQILTIVSAPILTRLYTPEEFGTLAIFSSIVMFLSIIITLRYEVAIVLPKEKKDAANLLVLSLSSAIIATVLLFIIVIIFGDIIANLLNAPKLEGWLMLVPVSALLIGGYNIFNYWLTRNMKYKEISLSRLVQSSGMVSTQIFSGFIGAGTKGLIGGQLIGQLLGLAVLLKQSWKDRSYIMKVTENKEIKRLAVEYKDFPLYNSSQSLVNAVSSNVMLFVFSAYFGAGIVGLYSMALRMIQLPAGVVSNAIKQVYFQRASDSYNNGNNIYKQLIKATMYLAIIGIIPSILIFIFAPSLFELALGSSWREAGNYASWLIIWLFFGFMNTPSLATIQIIGLQKMLLYYEIILMITRVITILICSIHFNSMIAIIAYSCVGAFFNLILITTTIILSKYKKRSY